MKLLNRKAQCHISPFMCWINGRSLFGHIIFLGGIKQNLLGIKVVRKYWNIRQGYEGTYSYIKELWTFISPCCSGKDCIQQCKRCKWPSWQLCCISAKEFLLKTFSMTFWVGTMSPSVQESKVVMIILLLSLK